MAEQEGLSQDEIKQAQQFESEDPQRAATLRFARDVVETRGHPSDETFEGVCEAGYTDEQIMEMIANVVLTQYGNYMNESIHTEVDFPIREPISSR